MERYSSVISDKVIRNYILRIRHSFSSAIFSLKGNILHSTLATVGIVVGVVATIVTVAIIESVSNGFTGQFKNFGTRTLTVRPHNDLKEFRQERRSYLTLEDYNAVLKNAQNVNQVTPVYHPFGLGVNINGNGKSIYTTVIATNYSYAELFGISVPDGRFLSPIDGRKRSKVAILGAEVAESIGVHSVDVGSYIRINDYWFKIIGIASPRGNILGVTQDDFIIVPFETSKLIAGNVKDPQFRIHMRVVDFSKEGFTRSSIVRAIATSRGSAGYDNDFEIQTKSQLTDSFEQVTSMITSALIFLVGLSLLVGGIGIMNIMLVSVSERRVEIGVLKAIGARPFQIKLQFLLESILISGTGAAIGAFVAYLMIFAISTLPVLTKISYPIWAAVLSTSFSLTIGVVFGIGPALKAAKLDPLVALRGN